MTGDGSVHVYQRRRDGKWVAAADTAELHVFAVVATEREATTAARYLGQMAAALKGAEPAPARGEFADGKPPLREGLVLPREEFAAVRKVHDALYGEGK